MINLLFLLCSFIIQFGAIEFPLDYTPVNNQFFYIYSSCWEKIVGNGYNINPDLGILVDRSGGNGTSYGFFYPAEPLNGSQSSITCTNRNSGEINVNSVNWYRWICNSEGYPISGPSIVNIGSVGFYDIENNSYTRYENIIYNGYYTLPFSGVDTFNWSGYSSGAGTLPGLGSMSTNGHSFSGDPLENLDNFSWDGHISSYIQSGHNTHVNPSLSTPDYSNATQNLLGQVVDNTNSIIENTNNLGGALETINGNIISGIGALFNGVSQLNSNFVSSVIIDKDELSEQWEASNTYLAFASMRQSYNLLESTTNNLIDRYSATEDVDELIIPIDLTVWQINSSVYGNFKPFDEVYYLRFGFLDETKSLWQPLFIALLYFCLFYGIVLDLPNIIRGAK